MTGAGVNDPKPFASLSSGLLARKGAARPAMRPQGFGHVGNGLEDLGWNDMGFEPPKPAVSPVRDDEHDAFGEELPQTPSRTPLAGLTPVESPVHSQHAEIEGRLSSYTPADGGEEEVDETAEIFDPAADALELATEWIAPAAPIEPSAPAPAPRAAVEPAVRAPVAKERPIARGKKAAFTLRLDLERHLKLRLACAVDGRSAQQLVTEALDQLLASIEGLDAMVAKAKRKG